jgi:hypothetical protein
LAAVVNFQKRLRELESHAGVVVVSRWLRIMQNVGQSEGEAIAEYEAGNGSVGNHNLIIRRVIDAKKFDEQDCAARGLRGQLRKREMR